MKTFLVSIFLFVSAAAMLSAQSDEKAPFDPEKADPAKLTDVPLSVIDKLIAVEQDMKEKGLEIKWKEIYLEVRNDFPLVDDIDDARACVLIGFKMADATMALKAQDAEELKRCVEAIEKLSTGLDVPGEALNRAAQVKSAVERNDWMDVFMQLSMMRQDIGKQLESLHRDDRSRGVLMVCGAWMQALRIACVLVSNEALDATATNYLRAPLFVQLMQSELEAITDPELKQSPQVRDLSAMMPEILKIVSIDHNPDIPAGQIPKENMDRLRLLADKFLAAQL